MSAPLFDIPIKTIDGHDTSLRPYAGHVLLVVNVASQCGLTPQYAALEQLFARDRERGLVVVGFPSNDFGAQEPGSNAEIAAFCESKYQISFPLFEKIAVKGDARHPLYEELISAQPEARGDDGKFRSELAGYGVVPDGPSGILWNFEKFVIARDGAVAARFAPDVTPDDPALRAAIEAELAKPSR